MNIKKTIYGIIVTIVLVGIAISVIIFKPIIETRTLYKWVQSLDENKIEVETMGGRSFSTDEKKELVKILKGMSRQDLYLLEQGEIGDGCDYALFITVNGEEFSLWHSFVKMYDVAMTYKGKNYTFECERLQSFIMEMTEIK